MIIDGNCKLESFKTVLVYDKEFVQDHFGVTIEDRSDIKKYEYRRTYRAPVETVEVCKNSKMGNVDLIMISYLLF